MGDAITQATPVEPWICPSCRVTVATRYCAQCGERPLDKRDLTLRGLLLLALETFTSFDSKFFRTFRHLMNHPGFLTLTYVRGERLRYIGPFALFFTINAMFFVVQSMTNVNIFSSTLDSHMYQQDWSALAQSMVAERLDARQVTLGAYTFIFNKAVVINAKSLVILMAMPFALLLPVFYFRSHRPFMTHVAFSLHLYAFLLVLFCVMMAVAVVDMLLGGQGLASARMDNILSVVNLMACATYIYFAAGKVYDTGGVVRLLQVVMLTIAAAAIVVGYRFAIFLITFYTT